MGVGQVAPESQGTEMSQETETSQGTEMSQCPKSGEARLAGTEDCL